MSARGRGAVERPLSDEENSLWAFRTELERLESPLASVVLLRSPRSSRGGRHGQLDPLDRCGRGPAVPAASPIDLGRVRRSERADHTLVEAVRRVGLDGTLQHSASKVRRFQTESTSVRARSTALTCLSSPDAEVPPHNPTA